VSRWRNSRRFSSLAKAGGKSSLRVAVRAIFALGGCKSSRLLALGISRRIAGSLWSIALAAADQVGAVKAARLVPFALVEAGAVVVSATE
jgi:hypothetical protein